MADAFPLLRRMHLFISVTDDELRELASHFELVTFKKDDVVFKQGDAGDAFYAIQEGQVEITRTTLTGGSKLVSKLVAGDYFGEMSLQARTQRSATITALAPLKLWKLSQEDYHQSISNNPKIKPHLEVALRTRLFARDADFINLLRGGEKTKDKSDEIVYLATLQHSVFLWRMLLPGIAIMLALAALAGGIFFFGAAIPPNLLPGAWASLGVLALLDLGWMRWNWVDFHNDWYIVTNKRIIDIDKVVFFFDSRAEVPLTSVSNTAIKSSEWGQIFGYGDLIVNTFSGPIIFHNVPNPQATADMILEHLNRTRIQQKMQERDSLKTTIRRSLAPPQQATLSKAPPLPAKKPATPPKFLQEFQGLRQRLNFSIREQQGDTIVYHKHHLILLQRIGLQLLGVIGVLFVLFLYVLRTFPFNQLPPLTFNDVVLGLALAVAPVIFFLGAAFYQFLDWRNDIYMVTATQIVDLERKPLGEESRKAASLESVMNVSYTRPSPLANLLNYGTVIVQTGPGGEMRFFNVFNPLAVQQDIYRRKEARAAAVAAAASKQRQEELGQYFSAFYEVIEEDRQKRAREGKL